MGAVSYLAHERITNTRNLTKYLNHQYLEKKEFENESLQISNEFILGLRKIEGLSIVDFEKKYHQSPLAYPSVKKLLAEKKLELSENFLRIPKHYFYLSNEILIEFI